MGNKQDAEKARYWRNVIREAARCGTSVRVFCQQRKLKECQFYWWRSRLKEMPQQRVRPQAGLGRAAASFALVADQSGATDCGIELVLGNGRRLRINKGVDAATLRSVLAVVQSEGC